MGISLDKFKLHYEEVKTKKRVVRGRVEYILSALALRNLKRPRPRTKLIQWALTVRRKLARDDNRGI